MSFWKTKERNALLRAFDKGSNMDLCWAILCRLMDRDTNIVKTERSLAVTIADLTGRPVRRIQEALERLEVERYGTWDRATTFEVNVDDASKTKHRLKYRGPKYQSSDQAHEFYTSLNILYPRPEYARNKRKDEMIAKLNKKIDQQSEQMKLLKKQSEETLALLRELVAGQNPSDAKQKAERHLRSVPLQD